MLREFDSHHRFYLLAACFRLSRGFQSCFSRYYELTSNAWCQEIDNDCDDQCYAYDVAEQSNAG